MSVGFTPGPWRIGRLGTQNQEHVVDMGNPPNAPFAVIHSDGPREEVVANAHLIASSPRLYAMLREIRGLLPQLIGDSPTNIDLGAIDALLAKARGDLVNPYEGGS